MRYIMVARAETKKNWDAKAKYALVKFLLLIKVNTIEMVSARRARLNTLTALIDIVLFWICAFFNRRKASNKIKQAATIPAIKR